MLDDIRKSLHGDADAYRRLIEQHQAAVGKLLWRFTRDPAEHEELVQQVFVDAYLGLRSYRGEAPFEHWLSRIAVRVGYALWRQKKRRKTVLLTDEHWKQLAQSEDPVSDSREAGALVHRLLERLPQRDRLVLTLRYLEQCDVAQTAYRLGWTPVRVRVQTHRAIEKLRTITADTQIEVNW